MRVLSLMRLGGSVVQCLGFQPRALLKRPQRPLWLLKFRLLERPLARLLTLGRRLLMSTEWQRLLTRRPLEGLGASLARVSLVALGLVVIRMCKLRRLA